MSKIYINSTLGFKVPVKIPFSTPAEYDALVGQPDAWFDSICAVECYSNFNTAFGNALTKALVETTGVEVPDDPKKPATTGADGAVIAAGKLTPKHYIRLLLADKAITEEALADIVAKVADAMPALDVSPSSRSNAIPKEVMAKAKQWIATAAANNVPLDIWLAKVEDKYPGAPVPSEEDGFSETAVARIIMHVQAAQLQGMMSI